MLVLKLIHVSKRAPGNISRTGGRGEMYGPQGAAIPQVASPERVAWACGNAKRPG